jgi:hypothetical protein
MSGFFNVNQKSKMATTVGQNFKVGLFGKKKNIIL